MRVLHIITGLSNGGAEAILFRLATSDKENTHQVISLMDSGFYGNRLEIAGVAVHTLNMPHGRPTLRGLFRLFRLIRTINPDIIQTWMYHADLIGGIVARLAGRRSVVWGVRASDAHMHNNNRSFKSLLWLGARFSRKIPARIIFASEAGARIHHELGYVNTKSVVISNGYDPVQLCPDRQSRDWLRAIWRIPSETVAIGMVARWDPLKDHENLIAALDCLNVMVNEAWLCVLIGPAMTDENHELGALLKKYGVTEKVQLYGLCSDIPTVMNALDIHVLSSKSEAFPNVIAEAMACGTPCVVTRVGDASLIVGETGWVVSPSDPSALADALREAMQEMRDASRWVARKAACRTRILENFSMDRMIGAYNKIWKEVSNA